MLGSYSADPNPRSTEVISDVFPSGMLARATYNVTSKVVDIDGQVWLGASILRIARMARQNNEWSNGLDCKWQLKIAKDW
jgi:hypothetical protein